MTDLPASSSGAQNLPSKPFFDDGNVSVQQGSQQSISVGGVGGKEKEIVKTPEGTIEEVGVLPEIEPELREAGIEQVSETVELPQPVSVSTGMTHAGSTTPVSSQQTLTVKIPLTDDQIKKALHQKIYDSILWLAYWCIRQVKIAHARIAGKEVI